jgi:hypothetical protein
MEAVICFVFSWDMNTTITLINSNKYAWTRIYSHHLNLVVSMKVTTGSLSLGYRLPPILRGSIK